MPATLFFMRFTNPEKNLLLASNLWYLGEGLFGPLFAVFSQEIGGSILDVSWAWAMFMVVTGFATIIVGKIALTERRQKWFAVAGYAINALMTFGYLFVQNPAQLMVVQAVLGIAQALATPTWYALYSQYGRGGESWGQAQGQSSIIMGIAFVAGGSVATYVSFQALFVLMGLIQIVATVAMFGLLRPDEETNGEAAEEPASSLTLDLSL